MTTKAAIALLSKQRARQRYENRKLRGLRDDVDAGGGGGVTDHGVLTGLGDDDHLQYHTDARADAWLATKSLGASSFTFVTSTPYTTAAGELLAVDTTSAAITVNLPTGVTDDIIFIVPNDGDFFTNNLIVAPASGENFEGAAADETLVVDDNVQFYLQYTGTEWEVFGVNAVVTGGGGGGGGSPLSPPVAADFTQWTGGSSPSNIAVADELAGVSVSVDGGNPYEGVGILKTISGSTWAVTMMFSDLDFSDDNLRIQGLFVVDTSTDQYILAGRSGPTNNSLVILEGNALNDSGSGYIANHTGFYHQEYWIRAEFDGTTLSFSYSLDGSYFVEYGTATAATYFTNGPTRVGFGCWHVITSTEQQAIHCRHYAENATAININA